MERYPGIASGISRAAALCLLSTVVAAAEGGPTTRELAEVVPEYMDGALETAIIPTPQRASMRSTVFPVQKVQVVIPDEYAAPDTILAEIRALFGEDNVKVITGSERQKQMFAAVDTMILVGKLPQVTDWSIVATGEKLLRQMQIADTRGEDAYVLYSRAALLNEMNIIFLTGTSPAGDFWAFTTLRQMTFKKDGMTYVREGHVLDYPRFRFRGNKRPQQWEWRYKANYGWSFPFSPQTKDGYRRRYFRTHGAWIHHGSPLRATDAEMDDLVNGYEKPLKDGKTQHVYGVKEYYEDGCREFVLKFDDTGSALSEATQEQFLKTNGTDAYYDALHHFLVGMDRRIRALDEGNRVFFMPRPYSYSSLELPEFAEALLARGPLPEDMGLSVCGPQVISWYIPTACLKDYRELFGLKEKAQIYDNFGRGGELFATSGRQENLWLEVGCLFPERGTPVTRITVYDYLWNPAAYDPERSLQLAVRELSGRDPEVYKAMLDFVRYYNEHRNPAPYPSPDDVRASLPGVNRTMKEQHDALVPLLERSPLAQEVELAKEIWGPPAPRPSWEWGEYARLRRRLEFEPYALAYQHREAHVAPATDAIVLDGKLDEPAWKSAPPFPDFVKQAWTSKEPLPVEDYRLPPDQRTTMRALYTDTHLYCGIEFHYAEKPNVPGWAEDLWSDLEPGSRANVAWRVPCFEIFLDVTGKREEYYQLVSNIAGHWCSMRLRGFEPRASGGWWKPDWQFKFVLGETAGSFEASVPLADLTAEKPGKGTVWGAQVFRSKMGELGLFSGVYDMVGGEHATREFGRWVFD